MINDDTMDNVSKTHTETLSLHANRHTQTQDISVCACVVTGGDYQGERDFTAHFCAEEQRLHCMCIWEHKMESADKCGNHRLAHSTILSRWDVYPTVTTPSQNR